MTVEVPRELVDTLIIELQRAAMIAADPNDKEQFNLLATKLVDLTK